MKKIIALMIVMLMMTTFAEDRVLLVGVAEYQDPRASIAGPDVDLDLMIDIVSRLGFSTQQRKILRDSDATKGNVLAAIEDWLVKGVNKNDRLIFYYSGHGARTNDLNGEEDDNCDEGLAPYDADLITDDELNAALSRSPATEIMVIVDSCFSGNVIDTRGGKSINKSSRAAKFYPKDGSSIIDCNTPSNYHKGSTRDVGLAPDEENAFQIDLDARSMFISAADQDQVSYAARPGSGKGSLFTQSLADELVGKRQISFNELVDAVAIVIERTIAAENNPAIQPHTPTLTGPSDWQGKNFFDFGNLNKGVTTIPYYPMDTTLNDILGNKYFNVDVRPDKRTYRLRENLEFSISSEVAGYIYIYDRGASGNLTLLFPNEFHPSSFYVQANETVRIPSARIPGFRFPASPPTGTSRLVALVSERQLDLYSSPICGVSGGFDFCRLSDKGNLEIRMEKWDIVSDNTYGSTAANSPRPSGTSFGAGDVYIDIYQ